MFKDFFRHYLELPPQRKNIVCLGGGIGTAQILKGLRSYSFDLTAIVSMADDGGSSGRLRRAFAILPPGDLVNCLTALSEEESILKELFLYRFSAKKASRDTDLGGQKLGNLIFVALRDIYHGDEGRALVEFSKIISPRGRVLPATLGNVNIWAKTAGGKKVYGESNIDLGKYDDGKTLGEVFLDPPNIAAYKPALDAVKNAQVIIAGPGDLFTTTLPVLIIRQIKSELKRSKAFKIFIVNIANKPFETATFKVSKYLAACETHLQADIFDKILVNTNHHPKMPSKLRYQYVRLDLANLEKYTRRIIEGDFVNRSYPLYHDSDKIARAITAQIK